MVFVDQSVSQCQSVSQSVCPSIFVNSVRTAGPIGTGVPAIDAPNRRNDDGTDAGVDRRHVARGTCRRVKVCKKLLTHLQVEQEAPPIRNWQVTRTLPQPVCFCGCRSCGVQAARARGGKLF